MRKGAGWRNAWRASARKSHISSGIREDGDLETSDLNIRNTNDFGQDLTIPLRQYEKRMYIRRTAFFLLLFGGVVVLFILSVTTGSYSVRVSDVIRAVFGDMSPSDTEYLVIMTIRLPRVLAAFAGGAALAVSGLMLQTFFQNPIVESYVLGVSSGASLFVGLFVLAGMRLGITVVTPLLLVAGAFLGSMLTLILVLYAATRVKNIVTLLMIGLMCGYICSAVISILTSYADKENIAAFVSWGMGSFSGILMEHVLVIYGIVFPVIVFARLLAKPLNALSFGESYARSMGIRVKLLRYALILISGLLTSVITAFAGPVSFVGLAVPHMCRILFRTGDQRILLPAVVLGGALMAAGCDFLARTLVAPRELPLSAITAFVGVPVIVYLLKYKEKYSYE